MCLPEPGLVLPDWTECEISGYGKESECKQTVVLVFLNSRCTVSYKWVSGCSSSGQQRAGLVLNQTTLQLFTVWRLYLCYLLLCVIFTLHIWTIDTFFYPTSKFTLQCSTFVEVHAGMLTEAPSPQFQQSTLSEWSEVTSVCGPRSAASPVCCLDARSPPTCCVRATPEAGTMPARWGLQHFAASFGGSRQQLALKGSNWSSPSLRATPVARSSARITTRWLWWVWSAGATAAARGTSRGSTRESPITSAGSTAR